MERVGEIRVLLLRSYFLYGALPSVVGMLLVTSTFLWPEFQKIATYIGQVTIFGQHIVILLWKMEEERSRASFHQNCYAIAMACSFVCFHHFKCLDICFQRDILGASWPKNDQAPAVEPMESRGFSESAGKLRMWGMLGTVGIWDVYYLIYIYIYIIVIYVYVFICINKYMCVVCKYIYICVCLYININIYIYKYIDACVCNMCLGGVFLLIL